MPSFLKKSFKAISDPVLKKAGFKKAGPLTGDNPMGALLRFLLINALSVIGAKIINEVTEKVSEKMFKEQGPEGAVKTTNAEKQPATLALETKHCKKCGAFVIKGQSCDCA